MEIFEQLLSETPKKLSLHLRKLSLDNEDTILYGAPKCGKTSLALLHALKKKEPYLYINLFDLRLSGFDVTALQEFVKTKKLFTLIIDGYSDEEFIHIEGVQTILISSVALKKERFASHMLSALDFEEYLSFYEDKGHSRHEEDAVAHTFADFLKDGSSPKILELSEFEKQKYRYETIKSIANSKTEEAILVELLRKTAMKFSLLQIFDSLKTKIKISKDFFYSYAGELEDMGLICFIEKLHQKNSPKKIYSYDFALKTAVDFKKDFSGVFENMVFLELHSRGYELYYADEVGLFAPELEKTTLAKPFLPQEEQKLISKLSKKALELGVREVEIITINKEDEAEIDGVCIHTTPFWSWALGF